jgi:hypothetical protein
MNFNGIATMFSQNTFKPKLNYKIEQVLHASDIYHNILVSKHICDILEAMIRAYVN